MTVKRIIPLLAFSIGSIGLITCLAAGALCWSIASRINRANQLAFENIDTTLAMAHDRLLQIQATVQESESTVEDVQLSLQKLRSNKSIEQVENRLEIRAQLEGLSNMFQQAESRLQFSTNSIEGVERLFEVGQSLGAPVEMAAINSILQRLSNLQDQLSQMGQSIEQMQQRVEMISDAEALNGSPQQPTQLLRRAVAVLSKTEVRIGQVADGIVETRSKGPRLESRITGYINIARIIAILLIAWMAAGQYSLCRSAWNGWHQVAASVDH